MTLRISEWRRREKCQSGYDSPVFVLRSVVLLLTLALALSASAPAEEPRSAAYPFLLAGALLADGDTAGALAAYAEAAALAPDDPYVHLEYASVLARTGRFVDAAGESLFGVYLPEGSGDKPELAAAFAKTRAVIAGLPRACP